MPSAFVVVGYTVSMCLLPGVVVENAISIRATDWRVAADSETRLADEHIERV